MAHDGYQHRFGFNRVTIAMHIAPIAVHGDVEFNAATPTTQASLVAKANPHAKKNLLGLEITFTHLAIIVCGAYFVVTH